MDSHASINVNSQFLELCGITASSDSNTSSVWDTDQASDARERFASVDSLLQNYVAVFTSTDNVADLPCRVRVDVILVMSLGIAKQKLLGSLDAQTRSNAEQQLETLFWGHDQFISVPVSFLNPCDIRSSAIDYVLWYGDTRELQTNLVVLRVDEPLDGVLEKSYCFAALAATAMIHHGQTKRHTIQGTYGVVTDGLKWTFLHVNKKDEYSSFTFNWLEGDEHAIRPQMAKTWDSPQRDDSEGEEMDSLGAPAENLIANPKPYIARKTEFLAEFKDGCKDLLRRMRGGHVENRLEELYQVASEKLKAQTSKHYQKGIESIAVTKIEPNDLFLMFNLRREQNPGNYWRLAPWQVRPVSSHLATTLGRIRLNFGRAKHNEAVIRMVIDAVLLDVMTSIKIDAGQYEEEKGKGKTASTDSTLSVKNLQMALETDISYIMPTHQRSGGVINKLISGRMDYNLWYGQPSEAETNLLVVEAKNKNSFAAGRYQAIAYMTLIQHARHTSNRAKIPIYGIATDSDEWDFIRMDATGNVDIQQFSWEVSNGSRIVSLLYKIVREASTLTPAQPANSPVRAPSRGVPAFA
ncbi:hypothetical protein BJX99DRAFT_259165 [Aspergillus californicus]